MRTENWYGYSIRFVEIDGEWWAILKDICDALGLKVKDVTKRLNTDMMKRVSIDVSESDSSDVRSRGENKSRWMIVVNELGVYEALFTSRKLEARKFRMWAGTVMKKLRQSVGLEQYEVMRMTEPEVQDEIDWILDSLYWDEDRGCVMRSITIQGGDTDQVPFE